MSTGQRMPGPVEGAVAAFLASPYPDGYRDPPCDGTPGGFAAVVLPARRAALLGQLNATMGPVLPPGVRFVWE